MTFHSPSSLPRIATLLMLALVAPLAAATAQDNLEWIDGVCRDRTEMDLGTVADRSGAPIIEGTLSRNSTATHLFVASQLESAGKLSLDDLKRGADLAFVYTSGSHTDIPAGFYRQRFQIDDATKPEGLAHASLIDRDGRRVAEGFGEFGYFGELPDPSEPRKLTCTTTVADGVDENGGSCTNVVMVCTADNGGAAVMQGCMKTVE